MSALDLERSEALYREMLATKDEAQRYARYLFQQNWGRFYRCRTCMHRVQVVVDDLSGLQAQGRFFVAICPCLAGSPAQITAQIMAQYAVSVSAAGLHIVVPDSKRDWFEARYRLHQYEPPPEAL